jgi:pyruvate/2-oxoglutarate dehydrogenase complex dihydrolipoamide acyltransferase (E2) component
MPKMGLTMEEGELLEWRVSLGDAVTFEQEIALIETEKVEMALTSPCNGRVAQILVPAGTTCDVGTILCVIHEDPARS